MGLFRQKDELFEIMSRAQQGIGSSSTTTRRSAPSTSSTGLSRTTKKTGRSFSPISWGYGRKDTGLGDLVEIDGEPLVIVEDGLTEALETAEEAPARTYNVRADTLVVGSLLSLGLVFTAFFVGRHTGEETPTPTTEGPALAVATSSPTPGEPTAEAESTPTQVDPNSAAAQQRAERGNGTLPAGFRPTKDTSKPASAPRNAKKGKYTLIVCTTTAANAKKVAEWLNTNSRSPIFGRQNLKAYGTSRGSVRIRGFDGRDKDLLKRVRATYDPLSVSSQKFSSAYYLKVR